MRSTYCSWIKLVWNYITELPDIEAGLEYRLLAFRIHLDYILGLRAQNSKICLHLAARNCLAPLLYVCYCRIVTNSTITSPPRLAVTRTIEKYRQFVMSYSSHLSPLIIGLKVVPVPKHHIPAALPPRKTWYVLERGLRRPQGQSGHREEGRNLCCCRESNSGLLPLS
jgi:hypothetical protein